MILLPASAEPAANAGTGPDGHKRSSSVDSGAPSDATMVAFDIDWIDGADMGGVDGCHKLLAIEKGPASPPERPPTGAAGIHDPEAHDAQRSRVSTDTASGAPALATHTNTAGSPTAAAPVTESINTATALAVADPYVDALNEPNKAPDAGDHEAASAHSAPAAAFCTAAGAAAPGSDEQDDDVVPGSTASASGPIVGLSLVDHGGFAQASASATTSAATALGSAASASATIDANPSSRGDAGCPETPVISRRSHAVAIRPFSIGRTSTPAPAPQAGGSKSAVIVANATSRVHAHCPSPPVISRLPMPLSHGAAVDGSQYRAFCIGRRSSASSAAAAPAVPPATATTPAGPPAPPPLPATALSSFGLTGSRVPSHSSPARIGSLHAVLQAIQRGVHAIRNALIALRNIGRHRSTSTAQLDNKNSYGRAERDDARWDEGAPVDAVLLGLRAASSLPLTVWRAR